MFRTKLVGYNRPGELCDPLDSLAKRSAQSSGRSSFINGKGVQLNAQNGLRAIPVGADAVEWRVFCRWLKASRPGAPGSKFKIFSMQSRDGKSHRQRLHGERPVPRRDQRQSRQQHFVQGAVTAVMSDITEVRTEVRVTGSSASSIPHEPIFGSGRGV